jgi:hypothetical protein
MSRDTATAAARNKRIRQEALREQLSNQKHLEHIVDILAKIQDEATSIDANMMQRYKIVLDAKFKLVDKYLPTEKPTSIEGDLNVGVMSLADIIAGRYKQSSASSDTGVESRPSEVRH